MDFKRLRNKNFQQESLKAIGLLNTSEEAEKVFNILLKLNAAPFWSIVKKTNIAPEEMKVVLKELEDVSLIEGAGSDYDPDGNYYHITGLGYTLLK